jgi:hypothetical protein
VGFCVENCLSCLEARCQTSFIRCDSENLTNGFDSDKWSGGLNHPRHGYRGCRGERLHEWEDTVNLEFWVNSQWWLYYRQDLIIPQFLGSRPEKIISELEQYKFNCELSAR